MTLEQGTDYLIHAPSGADRMSIEWVNGYRTRDRNLETEYAFE